MAGRGRGRGRKRGITAKAPGKNGPAEKKPKLEPESLAVEADIDLPKVKIAPTTLDLQIEVQHQVKKGAAKAGPTKIELKLNVESAVSNRKVTIEPSTFELTVEVDEPAPARGRKKAAENTLDLKISVEQVTSKGDNGESPSDSKETFVPKTVLEMRREAPGENYDEFVERVKRLVTPEYRAYLENLTQYSDEWKRQKQGRITASMFATVWNYDRDMVYFKQGQSDEMKMVDTIVNGSSDDEVTHPALKYGTDNKSKGKALYLKSPKTHKKPKSVKLTECGLFLDKDFPLAGASPNALVSCDCCDDGIVLVKCCYKHRDKKPSDIPKVDRGYHIIYGKDNKLAVCTDSTWYYQIVGLLGVTGKAYCDVVVYTNKGIESIRVDSDGEMYETLLEYCTNIFADILDDITKKSKKK